MSRAPGFTYTPEKIEALCSSALKKFEKHIWRILAIPPAKRSFANTVASFDSALAELEESTRIPQFLSLVSPSEEIRRASEAIKLKMGRYVIGLYSRRDIYSALKGCLGVREKSGTEESLLLNKFLRDFERNGLGLPERKRKSVSKILCRLVELSLSFQKNLLEVSDVVEMSRKDLVGLPDDYVARLRLSPEGKYLVGMSYPEYLPFMENAVNRAARRRIFKVFSNRCGRTNVRLLEEALVLRGRLARLLGCRSFAEHALRDNMAGSVNDVGSFLRRLRRPLAKKAKRELSALEGLNAEKGHRIAGWDIAFCVNAFNKTQFPFEHDRAREYFPLEKVLGSMLGLFGELLGVKFIAADIPVWHRDVRAYEVRGEAGRPAAYVYFDLFPRKGKFTHGMCATLRAGWKSGVKLGEVPAAAVVANFTPASSARPSLLRFSEVETLFHEFGHVAYCIFSKPKFHGLSSVNAPRDFVEVPSMLFQSWASEPEVLERISGHYMSPDKKVPPQIAAALLEAKNSFSGWTALRLLALSCVDMRYHSGNRPCDTTEVYRDMVGRITMVPVMAGTHPQAGLIHLMPAYAAGLYGYLWAEVIAADIFSVFKKKGLTGGSLGRRYVKRVLMPGSGRNPREVLRSFLGRGFSEDAYLRRIGA